MRHFNFIFFFSLLLIFSCGRSKPRSTLVLNEYFPNNIKDDSLNTLLILLNEPLIYKNQDTSLSIFRLTFFSKSNWLKSKVVRIEKYDSDTTISIYPNLPDSKGGFGGIEVNISNIFWDTLQILLTKYNFENHSNINSVIEHQINNKSFFILEESKKGKYFLLKREVPINAEFEDDRKLLAIVNYIDKQFEGTQ